MAIIYKLLVFSVIMETPTGTEGGEIFDHVTTTCDGHRPWLRNVPCCIRGTAGMVE